MEVNTRKQEQRELMRELTIPPDYRIEWNGDWIFFNRPDHSTANLYQGWKLHISSRAGSLKSTVAAAAPVLFGEKCSFKIVATASLLRAFNDGVHGIGSVGKCITVYPNQQRIKEIAHRLADVLAGFEGPRIHSDRRLRDNAPVYYRFGPFSPRLRIDESGYVDVTVRSPDGRITSGRAGATYSAPDWIEDPFGSGQSCGTRLRRVEGALVIGDHYRITSAIVRTFRGSCYRAVDTRTGRNVIIKHAAAFVNETAAGDARSYLRNEIRILRALEGIDGVPAVLDHFAYGKDEYLVTTELGVSNLRNDVVDEGLFTCGASRQRDILDLAQGLLRVVDSIHQRGIVIRDLAPKNVVPVADGRWGLVDFELSRMDGIQLFGWTPGYSSKEQRNDAPASATDDYYSLGATMFYAVAGIDPITIDKDPDVNTARTLRCLAAICGDDAPVLGVISGLLDNVSAVRAGAAEQLRAMKHLGMSSSANGVIPPPPLGPIFRSTLGEVMRMADEALECDGYRKAMPPSVVAQVGSAGLVAELALHPDGLGKASALAVVTAQTAEHIDMPVGLLYGRMGVALAIQAAAKASCDPLLYLASERLLPGYADVAKARRGDIAHGVAGLGIGYLAFADSAASPTLALSLADECARRILHEEAAIEDQLRALPIGNPAHAISIADGFAHGRAGIAYFILAHAARSGEEESRRRARAIMDALVSVLPGIVSRAASRKARPMCASWCQGLAGIGTTLSRGAYLFDDQGYLAAARQCADACLAIAARVPLVTQCCGLAGVGELLLDLSLITKQPRYREDALSTLSLMLARSGGSKAAPRFPGSSLMDEAPGWGTGTTGVLSFLRRLINPATRRHWLADNEQLLPC